MSERSGRTPTAESGSLMRIETAAAPPRDWDGFVARHPASSAYHTAAAVAIGARAFRLQTRFLVARDAGGTIRGVLPLVEQTSLIFGRFLVSLPFFTYGGVLAEDSAAAKMLVDAAVALARERRVDHLELRHIEPSPGISLATRREKVSMVLPLPATRDALGKQLGSKLRSQIKRAERESPDITWGGQELLPDFYRVFAATMHTLGTPVYPRYFFEVALEALGETSKVITLRVKGHIEAAAIIVRHNNRMEVPWAAATELAKRSGINMRMYWEMLCHSLESGAPAFDFGRSSLDSGTYKFKAQWGAQPVQLHWLYWMARGDKVPTLNASNPKYALASRVWRRLPLAVANAIGPWIVRNLP
jgi:serine/alanine adding enzyme